MPRSADFYCVFLVGEQSLKIVDSLVSQKETDEEAAIRREMERLQARINSYAVALSSSGSELVAAVQEEEERLRREEEARIRFRQKQLNEER